MGESKIKGKFGAALTLAWKEEGIRANEKR